MSESLPHRGRYLRASHRQFKETVILVHHFGGNRASVKRHQDFLHDLGFDSVAFSLGMPHRPKFLQGTLIDEVRPRLRHRWESEIRDVFDAVPGPKIAYTFSFPSAATAVVMANRKDADVRAWICDGGPFLMPLRCFWNYFTHADPTPRFWRKTARMALGYGSLDMWSLEKDLRQALDQFRPGFPVLSIRSWQDPLVPIAAIDAAFAGHNQLRLETLTLPEAGHIDGFHRFPEDYKPRVAQFLNTHAESLNGH